MLRRSELWRAAFRPDLRDYDITTLEFYQPALATSRRTGRSALNQEPVTFWSQSAGTTGGQKLFPMTASFRRQFQRTVQPTVHGLLRRYPRFVERPVLYFAAAAPRDRSETGIEIGFISHYNYRTIPAILRGQYAFPAEVFRDAATFDRFAPVYALQGDLSSMFAVTPLSLKRLVAGMRAHREFILGSLSGDLPWDPTLPRPVISRDRLRSVSRLLRDDHLAFRELWPSLEFVCTWKTAICAAHLREIDEHLAGVDVVDAVYSATEGWITVPVPEVGGSVVHPGAHIFEFIAEGQEIAARNLVPLWALESGRRYEVFLTTAMGLVRYRLFDVVACTGFFNRAPVVEFSHKSGGIISLGLVSVSESELVTSLLAAGVRLRGHWRVGPNTGGNGLVLYVDAAEQDLPARLAAADAHLSTINLNYRIYTASGTMARLTFAALPSAHPLWDQGVPHAQSKPVLLIQACPL